MIPPAPLIRNTGTGIFATISPPFILMVRAYARAGATDLALPTFLC